MIVWAVLFFMGWFTLAQDTIIEKILNKIEQDIAYQNQCTQRKFRIDLENKFTAIQFNDQRQAIIDQLIIWITSKKELLDSSLSGTVDTIVFLCVVNAIRDQYDIWPLQYHSTLNVLASIYVQYLYNSKDFAHTTQSGIWLQQRIDATDYEYDLAWENLAKWYTNIDAVIDAWMASTGHRQNLLEPRYQDMWIAYTWWYRVHLFGTPTTGETID